MCYAPSVAYNRRAMLVKDGRLEVVVDAYITILVKHIFTSSGRESKVVNWRFSTDKLEVEDFSRLVLSPYVRYEVEHVPYNELLAYNISLLTRDKRWIWEVSTPGFTSNIVGKGYRYV